MDMPELIDDPRYRTNSKRCDNADSLDASIAQWFARHDSAVIHDLFDKADVVSGPVLDIEDIFEDDHYKARENILELPDEDFERVRMQGVVPRFGRTPGAVIHPGKGLGADNHAVYRDVLRSDERTSELQSLMRISYAVCCLKKK